YRALAGEVAWSGVVDWAVGLITRAVAGVVGFGVSLTRIVTFKRQPEGDLDTSGTVTRAGTFGRPVLAALTFTGIVNRKSTLYRALAGNVTFTGILRRAVIGIAIICCVEIVLKKWTIEYSLKTRVMEFLLTQRDVEIGAQHDDCE
ncbi:hypothetical protein KAR91_65290, partial [Candidatus Pacearchaeota archaeon]|nr:hypothetical protein [Candidatus Pacearchaeota archaeon]